ncbi:hypothetical protein Tco_0340891 [Tanacetum coccineum]
MDSDKYLEGQSMQRPPLFESDSFIYWKNRFETYVKSKDLDLWHVITNGDFQPIIQNPETKLDEVVPFEKQTDDLKRKLVKNNEAKIVIYNDFPKKNMNEFSCVIRKKKFGKLWLYILNGEQRSRRLKRAKVTAIEESKDLTSLYLDELIGNLKSMDVINVRRRVRLAVETLQEVFKREVDCKTPSGTKKDHFKEAETTKTAKVKGSALDAEIQIILLENVQSHRETRTKEHLLEVLGAIAVKRMIKISKTRHVL